MIQFSKQCVIGWGVVQFPGRTEPVLIFRCQVGLVYRWFSAGASRDQQVLPGVCHCRSLQGKGLKRFVEPGYGAQQGRRVGYEKERGLTENLRASV
jgi:hypothetical protein